MFHPIGTFEASPLPQWPDVAYRNDPEKKRLFGIELVKGLKPLDAALQVFPNAGQALWVSQFWLNDPLVVEICQQVVKPLSKLLDKDGLAARVLEFADEKDFTNRFYINEDKVRLSSFELYAKIMGFIGKENSTVNNFNNNVMKIELVAPEEEQKQHTITIDNEHKDNIIPLNVQLVQAS